MGLLDSLRKIFGSGAPSNGPPDAGSPGNGHGPPGDMIPCEVALERLFEYLDGELGDVKEGEVARHLEVCGRCYPRLRFEESFQQALHRVRDGEPPPEHVRERVLEALRAEGFADG